MALHNFGVSIARITLVLIAVVMLAAPAEAKGRRRHHAVAQTLPILRGDSEALAKENEIADTYLLERIANRGRLRELIADGTLLRVRSARAYRIDPELGENDPAHAALYAHAQPWVLTFMREVLGEGYRRYGRRYLITSLTRTESYQSILMRRNPSAAKGDLPQTRSSHLTGSTLDIRSTTISRAGKRWLRGRLAELERAGLIQATEEIRNGCFHVMVFPIYDISP